MVYKLSKMPKHKDSKKSIMMATAVILAKYGLEDFSVDQVVKITGFSKGTIYNRFRDRENLLLSTAAYIHEENFVILKRALNNIAANREKLIFIFWYLDRIYKEMPELYRAFYALSSGGSDKLRAKLLLMQSHSYLQVVEEVLYCGIKNRNFRAIRPCDVRKVASSMLYSNDMSLINGDGGSYYLRILDIFRV